MVAPAGFTSLALDAPFRAAGDSAKMFWLAWAEMTARLGLLGRAGSLRGQVDELLGAPEELAQAASAIKNTGYFRRWGAYTGLALEDDWRTPARRLNDLRFRLCLIARHGWGTSGSGLPVNPPPPARPRTIA